MTETAEERMARLASTPLDTEGIWIHVPRHAITREILSAEAAAREEERERCHRIAEMCAATHRQGEERLSEVACLTVARLIKDPRPDPPKDAIRALAGEEGEDGNVS